MAGAFGALGGDLSSITSNPASVAVFNKSEYVFGFSLSNNITEANYFDNISNDSKYSLDLGTIGAVFIENRNPKANDWNRISFSVGCNTKNIYDSRQLISGYNSKLLELENLVSKYESQLSSLPEKYLNYRI